MSYFSYLFDAGNWGGQGGTGQLLLQHLQYTVVAVLIGAVMLVGGRRLIPWLMHYTAHTGSRELFRLAVLAMALGVATGLIFNRMGSPFIDEQIVGGLFAMIVLRAQSASSAYSGVER